MKNKSEKGAGKGPNFKKEVCENPICKCDALSVCNIIGLYCKFFMIVNYCRKGMF
jgi:hypothetical protein